MPPKDKQNTLLGLLGNLLGFDVPKSMTSKDLPTGHEALCNFFIVGERNLFIDISHILPSSPKPAIRVSSYSS